MTRIKFQMRQRPRTSEHRISTGSLDRVLLTSLVNGTRNVKFDSEEFHNMLIRD